MADQTPQPDDAGSDAARLKRWRIQGLAAVGVIAFVATLPLWASGSDEPPPTTFDEIEFVCEEWVREKLVAPLDAEFGDRTIVDAEGEVSLTGPWTVTGRVSAPNRLGVTVAMEYTCRIGQAGDEWVGSVDMVE